MIPYDHIASAIRGVLGLSGRTVLAAQHVHAAQLRQLDRIEQALADALHRDGLSREAAAHSASSFVCQTVAAIRGGSTAAG